MIIWIFGNSKAGKTTLAKKYLEDKKLTIHLDGDVMRKAINYDLDLSEEGRYKNNIKIANLAKELENQGFHVIVSTICPYKKLRQKVKEITNCKFIYVTGGKSGENFPFEIPEEHEVDLIVKGNEHTST